MYYLIIRLPFDVVLRYRESFEDAEKAKAHMKEHFADLPAMEVVPAHVVGDLPSRVILFPEKR
jgi:hypothetical protein